MPTSPRDVRDLQRRAYLERVFERLEGAERQVILAKARHVLDLWEAKAEVHPIYARRWRQILDLDVDSLRSIVLAGDEEAAELRHCMPFAGVLPNRERAALRAR